MPTSANLAPDAANLGPGSGNFGAGNWDSGTDIFRPTATLAIATRPVSGPGQVRNRPTSITAVLALRVATAFTAAIWALLLAREGARCRSVARVFADTIVLIALLMTTTIADTDSTDTTRLIALPAGALVCLFYFLPIYSDARSHLWALTYSACLLPILAVPIGLGLLARSTGQRICRNNQIHNHRHAQPRKTSRWRQASLRFGIVELLQATGASALFLAFGLKSLPLFWVTIPLAGVIFVCLVTQWSSRAAVVTCFMASVFTAMMVAGEPGNSFVLILFLAGVVCTFCLARLYGFVTFHQPASKTSKPTAQIAGTSIAKRRLPIPA